MSNACLRCLLIAGSRSANGVYDEPSYNIRVAVGVGTAVFDVAFLVPCYLPRNPNRRASVGDAIPELLVGAGFVFAGQPLLDAVAVVGDMKLSIGSQSLSCGATRILVVPHRDC